MSKEVILLTEIVKEQEKRLYRLQKALGTLITWNASELGRHNVEKLLKMMTDDE